MRFWERVAELERTRIPFALATVVSRRGPISSHVGDRALVFADGRIEGFIGGACSRDIVRRHAIDVIGRGESRMLHIGRAAGPGDGVEPGSEPVFVPMTCASEGAAEVFVEPHIPARRFFIVGLSPIASALARVASALDFDVTCVVDESDVFATAPISSSIAMADFLPTLGALDATQRSRAIGVVASLGHYDEDALAALLDAGIAFVGLVASRKRATRLFDVLALQGQPRERIATIRNPVGLDLGARTPGDVAIAILAEIVTATPSSALAAAADATVDPICGMDVDVASARHRYEHDGKSYVFCCAGCRADFAADPARALAAARG